MRTSVRSKRVESRGAKTVEQATKRATPVGPRALPASSPSPPSGPLEFGQVQSFKEPEIVRYESEPSFEFSRNGKGDPSWSIKLGGGDLSGVVARVLALDARIRRELAGTPSKAGELDTSGDLVSRGGGSRG